MGWDRLPEIKWKEQKSKIQEGVVQAPIRYMYVLKTSTVVTCVIKSLFLNLKS